MNVLQYLPLLYSIYIQAFRLYIIALLIISLFTVKPIANSIGITANGYHLAIIELEFYTFMLIVYNFRPARFKRVILKSYAEEPAQKFKKENFFWMVYLATMLIIFGIPLLFFFGTFLSIVNLINNSNQFVLDHAVAWIPALLFLVLSFLKLWLDVKDSVNSAKHTVARTFYIFILTGIIGVAIYLLSLLGKVEADIIVMLCLAFNAALLWADVDFYLKARKMNN